MGLGSSREGEEERRRSDPGSNSEGVDDEGRVYGSSLTSKLWRWRSSSIAHYSTSFESLSPKDEEVDDHLYKAMSMSDLTSTGIWSLSDEVLIHILSYLSPGDLAILSLVCQRLASICADDALWRDLLRRYFAVRLYDETAVSHHSALERNLGFSDPLRNRSTTQGKGRGRGIGKGNGKGDGKGSDGMSGDGEGVGEEVGVEVNKALFRKEYALRRLFRASLPKQQQQQQRKQRTSEADKKHRGRKQGEPGELNAEETEGEQSISQDEDEFAIDETESLEEEEPSALKEKPSTKEEEGDSKGNEEGTSEDLEDGDMRRYLESDGRRGESAPLQLGCAFGGSGSSAGEEIHVPNPKICVIGPYGAGKTSLIMRELTGRFALWDYTAASAYYTKKVVVDGIPLNLNIWDTAGVERDAALPPMYYRNAAAIICVYDITRKKSLDQLRNMVSQIAFHLDPDELGQCLFFYVGTKLDLATKYRQVSIERGRTMANECNRFVTPSSNAIGEGRSEEERSEGGRCDEEGRSGIVGEGDGCDWREISSKTGQGVNGLFEDIAAAIMPMQVKSFQNHYSLDFGLK